MTERRGHIRKRVRKHVTRYEARVFTGRDADGKPQYTSRTFPERAEAERWLTRQLANLDAGVFVRPETLTVREYLLDVWFPRHKRSLSATTADGYYNVLHGRLVPSLGNVRLQDLRPGAINALYDQMFSEGRAEATVRQAHVILRRALKDAMRWELVARNAADSADPPKSPRLKDRQVKHWAGENVGAFLKHVRGDRLEALWTLAANTGMRRSELLGLTWDAVDLDAELLEVRQVLVSLAKKRNDGDWYGLKQPKTTQGRRHVALDPRTVDSLRDHRKRQLEERMLTGGGSSYNALGMVFVDERGEPLRPHRVSREFAEHVAAADLPRLTMHGLRHSHASMAFAAGIDAKVVQERLGHSTVSFTLDCYTHVSPDRQRDAARKIAQALSTSGG
jgi:integrase